MNKFIINDGWLIMGDVKAHCELAREHDTTKGGGLWAVDLDNRTVYLFSASTEYGAARKEDIKEVLVAGNYSEGLKGFQFRWSYEPKFSDALNNYEVVWPEEKINLSTTESSL